MVKEHYSYEQCVENVWISNTVCIALDISDLFLNYSALLLVIHLKCVFLKDSEEQKSNDFINVLKCMYISL